jgi:serine/threonine protein kinase
MFFRPYMREPPFNSPIRLLGVSHNPHGLLLAEAKGGGSLQAYLDQHVGKTSLQLRSKWCSQAAEAVCFLHQKSVIHSGLRVENYLLHDQGLLLCDFGGSTSGNIDGGHLPDSGLFNPNKLWVSTEATDIFSLGSIFYTIMTDHWPYCHKVDGLFSLNKFPSTDQIVGGEVI